MDYTMEELIPVVAGLAGKFTSKESTSITYERANQLMEAVIYCINECTDENTLTSDMKLPAGKAYQLGYEKVLEKVKTAQEQYNAMISDFCAYGNENYHDTVTKALPGFFLYYDARFAPQETVITMDYPTLGAGINATGIDAIEHYIIGISLEQRFLNRLPADYVTGTLSRFQPDYQKEFYNISSIILRHLLVCMLIRRKSGTPKRRLDYEKLKQLVELSDKKQLEQRILQLLETLVRDQYGSDRNLYHYLDQDITDFVTCLKLGARTGSLRYLL